MPLWGDIELSRQRTAAAVLIAVLAPTAALYGWGQRGHRIVADIAQERLTEVTKRNVQSLIGNNTLASVANWADQIRPERDETFGWHFVNIPKDAQGFSDSRDCYRPEDTHKGAKDDHQNCVVDRIEHFKRVLGDKSASRDDRIEALKFIIHFVGDIHQPLHAIGEAKGGNGIHVTEFGSDRCGRYPCNLHSAWDSGLIEHTGMDEEAYVAHLEQLIAREHLHASGNPADWANESFALAKAAWVNDGGLVDDQYYEQQIRVVDERLALAGLRLAAVLKEVLGRVTPTVGAAGGLAGAEYNGAVQFSTKREQRAELASIALLVLKILVYIAIAAGGVYLLIHPPVAD